MHWKVEIDERDRDETAFTSYHELYSLIKVPFWPNSSSATFQRAIGVIPFSVHWQFVLVYMNDIGVFLKST